MEYHIKVEDYKTHSISLFTANNYKYKVLEFEDSPSEDGDPFNFTRIVNNNSFIIKGGQIVCKTLLLKDRSTRSNYIKSVSKESNSKVKILSLDIETRTIDNKLTAYCIYYFDGKKSYSFYLSDYKTQDEMVISCIASLIRPKYFSSKIYVHNLSNFDAAFMLRGLAKFSKENEIAINILKRDSVIISIDLKIKVKDKEVKIQFRDSLLTLPSSLASPPYGPANRRGEQNHSKWKIKVFFLIVLLIHQMLV